MSSELGGSSGLGEFKLGAALPSPALVHPNWSRLIKKFKTVITVSTFDVTRRKLVLGSRDSTTGWRSKSYTESTIEMVIIPRAARNLAVVAGVYVRLDAVGLTVDSVNIYDEIRSASNKYYEVKGIKEHYLGDSLFFRECDLTELPLHE